MLLWILMYTFFYGHVLNCVGINLAVELLGYIVILCLICQGTTELFSKVTATFYIPTSNV